MAYVVVFNQGTDNEGVYTLEASARGSKSELLTFENTDDARRFARHLQGEEFTVAGRGRGVSLDAQCLMWDTRRIEQFCYSGNFELAYVPSGGRIQLPEKNVFDPSRFGARPQSPRESRWDGFQNRTRGQSMRNPRQNIQMRTNNGMSPGRQRGQDVWKAAMRNHASLPEKGPSYHYNVGSNKGGYHYNVGSYRGDGYNAPPGDGWGLDMYPSPHVPMDMDVLEKLSRMVHKAIDDPKPSGPDAQDPEGLGPFAP
jgi:hypothetical protein